VRVNFKSFVAIAMKVINIFCFLLAGYYFRQSDVGIGDVTDEKDDEDKKQTSL